MDAFRLIAGFICRVDRANSSGNEILSRSQIRRIGQKLAAEVYESKGASDATRDQWLKSAGAIVDGATDKLFLRQLRNGFDRELYSVQTAVDVLRDVQVSGVSASQGGRWCDELNSCSDLKKITAVLEEICGTLPDVGDKHYVKVDILRDLAALPGPFRAHLSPGAGLTAFG